ncbi:hypothetical protein L1987_24130 [Smallanthus sonchifolius]|uniref:Uncharacterized protein n=1 Tax=Smallanthus sonchifolius TaxID=185202 RepID=A0ACB9IKG7_9ASTR|nr:hypothetical protein L1987_24130 [Smallanthus sonchifolius]
MTVTTDDKKMMIDEMVINKKEMVMEVLMADNPGVHRNQYRNWFYDVDVIFNSFNLPEFIPQAASSSSTSEDYCDDLSLLSTRLTPRVPFLLLLQRIIVMIYRYSPRLTPRVPDPVIPAQEDPSTS